jgi:hypothetical protein
MKSKYYLLLKIKWTNKTQVSLEFWIFILVYRVFLFLRWTSKHYNLLKSIWTNKTQVALEFLNFHIIEQSFTSLTDWHQNIITYWKASGQIKLRLRWNSWIFILLYRYSLFLTDWHQNIITYWKASGQIKLRLRWNSWIFILLNKFFLFNDGHQNIITY